MEQSRNIKYSRRIIIQWIRINSLPPFYRSAWGVENIVYPSTQVFSNMPRIVFKGAPIGFAIKLVHAKVNRPKLYSEGCRFCKRLRRQMRCQSHATNVLPSNNIAWKLKMKATVAAKTLHVLFNVMPTKNNTSGKPRLRYRFNNKHHVILVVLSGCLWFLI